MSTITEAEQTQAPQPHAAAAAAAEEAEAEELPHLPDPSIWPIVLAFGMATLLTGIVLNLLVVAAGLLLVVSGLAGWIYQDIQVARRGDHHH